MAQTEIDALCNAKIGEKVEAKLRIQPPPQRRCLRVWGCIWIRWAEPEVFQNVRSPSTKIKCRHIKGLSRTYGGDLTLETLFQLLPNLELGEEICKGISVRKGGGSCRSPSEHVWADTDFCKALLENVYYFLYKLGRIFCMWILYLIRQVNFSAWTHLNWQEQQQSVVNKNIW